MVKKKQSSKPMTPAQRKAAERQRKREAGLIEFRSWCHPDDRLSLKEQAIKLLKKRDFD